MTNSLLRVCSTGAGPHAADGYHWTGGTRAEQARGGMTAPLSSALRTKKLGYRTLQSGDQVGLVLTRCLVSFFGFNLLLIGSRLSL